MEAAENELKKRLSCLDKQKIDSIASEGSLELSQLNN